MTLGVDKDFRCKIQHLSKKKKDKVDFIKIENFCPSKDDIKK